MWSFLDYRYRLTEAVRALGDLAGETGSIDGDEVEARRLLAKMEGVMLALSYFDEMTRDKSDVEKAMDIINSPKPALSDHKEWEIR